MKRRTIGHDNAQARRRARRAAQRRETQGFSAQDVRDIQALVADGIYTDEHVRQVEMAASGSTDLPLSDRNATWDAGAAQKTLDPADFPKAYFWRDPEGDASTKAAFKLPFATKSGGTLTAVWKGVTAAAGALSGARGGVSIPSGDVAGVKSKIASYYSSAAKKYDDANIKPPWSGDSASATRIAEVFGGWVVSEDEWDEPSIAAAHLAYAEVGAEATADEFGHCYEEWLEALTATTWAIATDEEGVIEIAHFIEVELGGKPNKGTKPDKRLKENDPAKPEENVLDAIDAYQAGVTCACGHAFSEHSGAGGTCSHEDGRGTCRCGEFSYPESDIAALAEAIVAVRPDLAGFEEQVMRIAERTLLSLQAAAGDIAWGPEDGFVDLLCDVNESLSNGAPGMMGPRAVDAGVKLDKVLICEGDDTFVAPITIDGSGEPVLSDRADWKPVESGWVEVADEGDDSMTAGARFLNGWRNFALGEFAPAVEVPQAEERIPEASDEIREPEPPAAQEGDIPWHATFVPEGKLTEDGRAFAPGSVLIPGQDEGARDLPLSLMGMIETSAEGGHDGAKVAGRIDALYRTAPNIEADGVFSNEEWGQMIARMVENRELKGLSVDIAPLDYSWVPKDQYFSESGDFIGVWNDEAAEWAPAPGTEHLSEEDDEDPLARFFGEDDRVLLITKAVVGMATVVPFPAFGDASISLTAAGMPRSVIVPLQMTMPVEALTAAGIQPCEDCRKGEIEVVESEGQAIARLSDSPRSQSDEPVLTAAAAGLVPAKPPAEWFADPEFTELTPFTITDEGRVYGHAWAWESCHLSFDRCVTAPRSETNYAFFMFGELLCEEGERLQVGRITFDTGHAGIRLSRAEAIRHYDDTGTQAAYVQFYEDEFGGAFAGCLAADFPESDLQKLRASQISGDWRGIDGNLELVALLAVNLGGFPVPRGAVTATDDEVEPLALVAAGIVTDGRIAEIQRLAGEVIETGAAEVPDLLADQIAAEVARLSE